MKTMDNAHHVQVDYVCKSCGYSISHSNPVYTSKTLHEALDAEIVYIKPCYMCDKTTPSVMSIVRVIIQIKKNKPMCQTKTEWHCEKCATSWISTELVPRGQIRNMKDEASCPNRHCLEANNIFLVRMSHTMS